MISDYWALDGTVDERCPEHLFRWTWNDYRPVLGENSWAMLLGPMQVAYMKYGSVAAIPNNHLSIQLALDFIPSLLKQRKNTLGAILYAPKNTFSGSSDLGVTVSTENNISLLGGLKMLRFLLTAKNIHMDRLGDINSLISSIEGFVKSTYDSSLGFFRQGGYIDSNDEYHWNEGPDSFAVDCQTWAMSVISPLLIDQWFGAGTSLNIWLTTKKLGGYNYNPVTLLADGVGFTHNEVDQVFSGEWTLGAINMLRIFAEEYSNPLYREEGQHMLNIVKAQLVRSEVIDQQNVIGVLYANKRYWIPFGWWANPVLSTVSTSWTVLVDSEYNPLHLGGEYKVNY